MHTGTFLRAEKIEPVESFEDRKTPGYVFYEEDKNRIPTLELLRVMANLSNHPVPRAKGI
jgi:hypothetical protein